MRLTDVLSFPWLALSGHRLRTGLSLLGMAIGVAAVVMLTALGEGARRYVTGQFTNLGTNLVIVVLGKNEPARPPGWAVVAAVVVALVAGLGFGVLPARRATELDPVAALGRG